MNTYKGEPAIALITPLRDEQDYVSGLIESIVNQQLRPERWVIVDDGSTDTTPHIVREYCRRFKFMELIELPARSDRKPGGEGAVSLALRRLDLCRFDYVARFDADLLLGPDYFVRLLNRFAQDPRLGIAGGGLYIDREGTLILERAPEYHIRGALKMYRRECFQQLGGLSPEIGWDTIDEVYAWSQGWRTRSFFEIQVIHRRPTGRGVTARTVHSERGRAEYLTWSHPAFVLLKTLRMAISSPANAAYFLGGFIRCYGKRQLRLCDPEFTRVRRNQQLARLRCSAKPEL